MHNGAFCVNGETKQIKSNGDCAQKGLRLMSTKFDGGISF